MKNPGGWSRRVPRTALLLAVSGLACRAGKPKPFVPPPPRVVTAQVERRHLDLARDVVGTVDGYINADIRARVRGPLQAQWYTDGAPVKAGQLLFSIDRAEYVAALAAAKATVAHDETARLHARAQLARKSELGASRVVSRQELEDAYAEALEADSQLQAARAQLRQAELNLSYTQIRSPVSGIAGIATVRVGNLVGQDGPTLLTTVSTVDPIRVTFPMSEADYVRCAADLREVEHRDRAWIEERLAALQRRAEHDTEAPPGEDDGLQLLLAEGTPFAYRGVMVAVNRQIDQTAGTIAVQALFPNPQHLLRPGQFARVRVRSRAGDEVLVAPETAVIQLQGTSSIAVVGADRKVHIRRVEVGPAENGFRVITGGVLEGENVVVEGVQKVSEGTTVTLTPPPGLSRPPAPIHASNPGPAGVAEAVR